MQRWSKQRNSRHHEQSLCTVLNCTVQFCFAITRLNWIFLFKLSEKKNNFGFSINNNGLCFDKRITLAPDQFKFEGIWGKNANHFTQFGCFTFGFLKSSCNIYTYRRISTKSYLDMNSRMTNQYPMASETAAAANRTFPRASASQLKELTGKTRGHSWYELVTENADSLALLAAFLQKYTYKNRGVWNVWVNNGGRSGQSELLDEELPTSVR